MSLSERLPSCLSRPRFGKSVIGSDSGRRRKFRVRPREDRKRAEIEEIERSSGMGGQRARSAGCRISMDFLLGRQSGRVRGMELRKKRDAEFDP